MQQPRSYREHSPGSRLHPYVECFWTMTHARQPGTLKRQVVLPDGCVDILFECCATDAKAFVIGTLTSPLYVPARGGVSIAAVRFRPGGAFPFFRRPVSVWTDNGQMLAETWPTAEPWLEDMWAASRLPAPSAMVERLRLELEQAMPHLTPLDPRVLGAIDTVLRRPGTRIGELSSAVGLSRQHLTRQVRRTCGIGPKRLGRVARVRRLLRNPPPAQCQDWAGVALEAGYYDQSHLISEFRELVGQTPARYFGPTS